MTNEISVSEAARKFIDGHKDGATEGYLRGDGPMFAAFAAGAAWQKARANEKPLLVLDADLKGDLMARIDRLDEELSTVLAVISMAVDKGLKISVDIGQKVEACTTLTANVEEGIATAIGKLDKLGVEKWREAIKHVEGEKQDAANEAHQKWHEKLTSPDAGDALAYTMFAHRHGLKVRDFLYNDETGVIPKETATDRPGRQATLRDVVEAVATAKDLAKEAGVTFDFRISAEA